MIVVFQLFSGMKSFLEFFYWNSFLFPAHISVSQAAVPNPLEFGTLFHQLLDYFLLLHGLSTDTSFTSVMKMNAKKVQITLYGLSSWSSLSSCLFLLWLFFSLCFASCHAYCAALERKGLIKQKQKLMALQNKFMTQMHLTDKTSALFACKNSKLTIKLLHCHATLSITSITIALWN